MLVIFFLAGALAIAATILAITRVNAVHALLYLIASLLALGVAFFTLGAPFAAVLEVVVYAGAIAVLLLFVVMMLNLGRESEQEERALLVPRLWSGPAILVLAISILLAYLYVAGPWAPAVQTAVRSGSAIISPKEVGKVVFSRYLLGVEAASFLLLAGAVGAFHVGRRSIERREPEVSAKEAS